MELRHFYGLCIIRTINGLVDPSQKGVFAESIYNIASRLGLPGWIVEIRHDATHDRLPSLSLLRSGARELLSWLSDNYWQPQQAYIAELSAVCVAEESFQPMTNEEASKRCDSSITFLTAILVPVIIESAVVSNDVEDMLAEAENRLSIWHPMIEDFHRLFPQTFVHQLTQRMIVRALDMITGDLMNDLTYKKILFGLTVIQVWLESCSVRYKSTIKEERTCSALAIEESYAAIHHRISKTISTLRASSQHSNASLIASDITRVRDILAERYNTSSSTSSLAEDNSQEHKRRKISHTSISRMDNFPIWPMGLMPGHIHANELLMIEEKLD
jgi:hypothetical protein